MAKRYTSEELEQIAAEFDRLLTDRSWSYFLFEPSPVFRRALTNALNSAGALRIHGASTVPELQSILKNWDNQFIPILIWDMNPAPQIDGIELVKRLRNNPALPTFKDAKVIFISGETRKERIIQAVAAGALSFIKKPFEPQVLIEKLISLDLLVK